MKHQHILTPLAGASLFLTSLAFGFPLLWGGVSFFDLVPLFSPVNLTLLALLLLLFYPFQLNRIIRQTGILRLLPWLLLPIIAVTLLHFFRHSGNYDILLPGFYYVAIFLLGAVFQRQFRRLLPCFLLFLGLANLVFTGGLLLRGQLPFGLTGNWNWSLTLSLLAAGAAGLLLSRRLPRNFLTANLDLLGAALFLLGYGMLFSPYLSRGSVAGFLLAGSTVLLWRLKQWRPRSFRLSLLIPAFLLLLLTLLPLVSRQSDSLAGDDIRADLNTATLKVIAEAPLFGVGPGLFESAVSPFLPKNYYLGKFAAERNPHPHNEFLFWLASFGIGGWCLAAVLLLAFSRAAEKYFIARPRFRDRNRDLGFYCFAFLLLLAHGMLDTLLANWPCDTLFLLIAGILWGFAQSGSKALEPVAAVSPETRQIKLNLLRVLRLGVAGFLLYSLFSVFTSGFYLREARLAAARGDKETYGKLLDKSRKIKPTPENIYRGAMVELFDRRNPAAAEELLRSLKPATGFTNYIHNQGLLARALAAGGKPTDAIPYFEQEQRNFPLGTVNLYFHEQVLRYLNREAEAEAIQARLLRNLTLKHLTPADIPMLIRNPQFDVNFHHIPRQP